jgi:hypothetical protein
MIPTFVDTKGKKKEKTNRQPISAPPFKKKKENINVKSAIAG